MCYSALINHDLGYLHQKYGADPVQESFNLYQSVSQSDPKRYHPVEDRVFPGHYAPVIFESRGQRLIEMMRYGVHPPSFMKSQKRYSAFNARRDNLSSPFWSEAFMHHHGFVVLHAFYEWVLVSDLLDAGVVKLDEVKHEFERQAGERKRKIIAAGKSYKPTATERRNPKRRQIIVEFRSEDEPDLLAPVIFNTVSAQQHQERYLDREFAIVTDDPPPSIALAGHDRCPVFLREDALHEWLHPETFNSKKINAALARKADLVFEHQLPGRAWLEAVT